MYNTIHEFGVIEFTLESKGRYDNFDLDCQVIAVFIGPSGQEVTIKAFWDGGDVWKIRFSPDQAGTWTWQTESFPADDAGLNNQNGSFECLPYKGDNQLYLHGSLKLSADKRRLEHIDGTSFFWLADTAWNGVIRGDDDNWRRYLETRVKQRFTAIQYVTPHWRGDELDEEGEAACSEISPIVINPAFFQRIDRRIAMINESGLIAAPVVLWSLLETDLGYKLSEDDAIRLASYIVARYDAYQVVWLLGGDGDYQKMGIERWKRIGRAVFSAGHDRLVTLHACGKTWIGEDFRSEDWYDIISYQSGHGDSEEDLQWLTNGPPATDWCNQPPLPVINMEPNYETACGYSDGTLFTDYHVRRAAYWSLLISQTAGVTYGHDAIWNWNFETGPSEGHGNWHNGAVPPWDTGLESEGIRSMTIMRGIFDRIDWRTLMPDASLLKEQPGDINAESFVAVARAGDDRIVIYSPCGGTVKLNIKINGNIQLIDPRTGQWTSFTTCTEDIIKFPDMHDWLAVCEI